MAAAEEGAASPAGARPPGGLPGGGGGLTPHSARNSIITTLKQREAEVADLTIEKNRLRAERDRWDELKQAGIPRREAAAADLAQQKARDASAQEKDARAAEHHASIEKKALEQATRNRGAGVKRAEDAARRAEEQLAAAERGLEEWRASSEAALRDARRRREQALAQARERLANAEAEAELRAQEWKQELDRGRARGRDVVAEERVKLERQRAILEARAEERRGRAQIRVQAADAAAVASEARKDREVATALQRGSRSCEAASSKVRLARLAQETVSTKVQMRLDQVKPEHELQLQAARAKEVSALKDLEKRRAAADVKIATAECQQADVCATLDQVESDHRARLDKLRGMLSEKRTAWEAMALDAEEGAREKVECVRAIAARLKEALQAEVKEAEKQATNEADALRARVDDQASLCEATLVCRRQQTDAVQKLANGWIAEAEELASGQLAEAKRRHVGSVDMARKELACTKDIVDGRVKKAVGHLMTYLERGETPVHAAPLSLELWIPLPGAPDQPGTPLAASGG